MNERAYLTALVVLGLCAGICLLGTVAISLAGHEIPAVLPTIAGSATGAIGGLLAQPPGRGPAGPAPPG
jgi:hypothetical protein